MNAPKKSKQDKTIDSPHFNRSCIYPFWIAILMAFFIVHHVKAAETNMVQALRTFIGITQKASVDTNAPGDAGDLAGKSVVIDLPGLPSGAKKLELVMLVPKKGSGIAPFMIGKYEVTQGQWQAVMGYNPSNFKNGPDYPVEMVSWDDTKAFCAKVNAMVKQLPNELRFRLPTDKEWSWAVGLENESGNTPEEKDRKIADVFPWGTQWPLPKGSGNYCDEAAHRKNPNRDYIANYDDSFADTAPVGSFKPNQYGLYVLGGNVWEWCEDWYNPSEAKYRVLRGAAWYLIYRVTLHSSFRLYGTPSFRSDGGHGFRVVLGMSLP